MPQTLFLSFTPSSALSGRTTTYVPFFRAKALTPGPTDCSPSPPPPRGGLNGHLVDADPNMPGGYRPAAPRDATRRRRARSGGPHAPPPPRTVQQQRELVDDQSLMTNAAPRVNVSPLSSSRNVAAVIYVLFFERLFGLRGGCRATTPSAAASSCSNSSARPEQPGAAGA